MLDDLVLQGSNSQRPLTSIRLGNIGPLGGLGTIGPPMNALMQVVQSASQSFLVLPPTHSVAPGGSVPLQSKVAVLESIYGDVME